MNQQLSFSVFLPHQLQICEPTCINFVGTIVIMGCQSLESSSCMYVGALMPQSHQTFRSILAVKLLGITFRNRWWPTTFLTITAGDADGWWRNYPVWSAPHSLGNIFAFFKFKSHIVLSSSQHLKLKLPKMMLSWFKIQVPMWGFCNDMVLLSSSINTYTSSHCDL